MLQPQPPFRSMSTTSNLSINSSSTSITRVALGPLAMNINFNQQSTPQDHLHYQSLILKNKLAKVEGMEPFLNLAFNSAEHCAEQQALALSQQMQQENSRSANDYRISVGSAGFSIHSDTSSTSNVGNNTFNSSSNKTLVKNNIFTYTAGVLPANISVDPATQLWKLFQQGAPLCLLFNAVVPSYQIPVIGSEDMRVCKKSVYDFLIAVKTYLNFSDDVMFTISNVFSDSTQEFIKIMKVVDKLLNLQKLEATFDIDLLSSPVGEVPITDERSKVFKEMIETERKYVKDLELLQLYKNDLEEADLLSSEQIHVLFPNITEIIDFQRRFLNGLECNINVPNKYQRIGSVFIHASTGPFKSYEPWTIGQLSALDLITKESSNLKKSSSLLDPGFELQSYILKPIQRLCKYPLLLKELIKNSPENNDSTNPPSASYNELLVARNAMKEMATEINEAQRRAENVDFLEQLVGRVSNWRGFSLKDQGELLLHGPVGVRDAENEKDYIAYLFDRIVFFFVELDRPNDFSKDKEPKKKREMLSTRKKSSASVNSSTINLLEALNKSKADKTSPLELKGRVYILEIYNISSSNTNGYQLVISWSGKKESGSFTLRYRTEETRNQWENCLRNLKSVEMNSQLHRKLRDSQGSQLTNDSSFYDVTAAYSNLSPNTPIAATAVNNTVNTDAISLRSSSGSSYQRHHSSSSTFSMMRQSRGKSGDSQGRSSSQSNGVLFSANTPMTPNIETFLNNIAIKLIYNSNTIPEMLMVSSNIQYGELYLKISGQIVGSGAVKDDILVNKLKYKDEDGDFVVMDSNDDWILAVDMLEEICENSDSEDSANSTRELTIWVS
jgi:cell division control protein 24